MDKLRDRYRLPETLAGLVSELGEHATAGTALDSAERGDIAIVTIPLYAIDTVPVEPLASRGVIDANNHFPERDGHIAELDEETTTTAEMLQAHLPAEESVADDGKAFVGSP
ncbi:hypothetical protein BWO91_17030 [Plantibacter flavus]|uniref:hypothetical protein n=1 Tax=Plantibacter flavus TaxID=150123 RepID=UPI00099BAF0E|nr:hypothetical protein [Plantibacter flavus]AQX81434.1 hypothetical protein BWO91_17030 [Plantibacter flavus]